MVEIAVVQVSASWEKETVTQTVTVKEILCVGPTTVLNLGWIGTTEMIAAQRKESVGMLITIVHDGQDQAIAVDIMQAT